MMDDNSNKKKMMDRLNELNDLHTNEKQLNSVEYWIDFFNKRYAVINIGGKTRILDEDSDENGEGKIEFKTFDDFHRYYCNFFMIKEKEDNDGNVNATRISVSKMWVKHPERRTYDGIVFDPQSKNPKNVYNLWKGFACKPIKGKSDLYWKHTFEVVCAGDNDRYQYLRKWMAHAVQKPWELPRTGIVSEGGHGAGKGLSFESFGSLFGSRHYASKDSLDKVFGKFNADLENKIVIFADEAFWGGYRQTDGALKNIITGAKKDIERKGIDSYQVNNYTRLIVSSNNKFPIRSEPGERRFAFYPVSDHKIRDFPYFQKIVDEIANGGREAILWDLMNEDISEFNPLDIPLSARDNELVDVVTIQSMDTEQLFVFELLHNDDCFEEYQYYDRHTGSKFIKCNDFYEYYVRWFNQNRKSGNPVSNVAFGKLVWNKILPSLGRKNKNKINCQVVPNVQECRKFFETNVLRRGYNWRGDEIEEIEDIEDIEDNNSKIIELNPKLKDKVHDVVSDVVCDVVNEGDGSEMCENEGDVEKDQRDYLVSLLTCVVKGS